MSTHQTWSTRAPTTRNGSYNEPISRASAPCFEFPLAAPATQSPVYDTNPESDRSVAPARTSTIPAARRLLTEAHHAMCSQSRQHGHDATVMSMILDHRLLISVETPPVDRGHRSPAPRGCAVRCQADIDTYWARQEGGRVVDSAMSKNIEPPISAERSTVAWPPNFDGDDTS